MNFKNISIIILVFSISLALNACSSQDKKTKTIVVKKSDVAVEKIAVDGMTCVGCEVTLEGAISKIEGVTAVKASAKEGSATVSYDKTKTNLPSIITIIQESGYKAKE